MESAKTGQMLTRSRVTISTGERRVWKPTSGVRRRAGGKGLQPQYLACGLSDWLLGFSGPKAEAEEIKREIRTFLRDALKLELSEEKTLITHARTSAAKFLGYQIVVQHADDKLDRRGERASQRNDWSTSAQRSH